MTGKQLKKLREMYNFTQAYMAEQLNMTQSGYSKIEVRNSTIPDEYLARLKEIFNMTPQEMEDVFSSLEKIIFQNCHSSGNNNVYTFNHAEKSLYEKLLDEKDARILLLEDKIKLLEQINKELTLKVNYLQ